VTGSSGSLANPFQYTGREFDSETGLVYYRARYYDVTVGRFLGEDPAQFAGGDVNVYRYVQNNPVVFMDPTGLATVINNTGNPVLVTGGLGPGFGHGGDSDNYYAIVPPLPGVSAGGKDHPLPAYPSAQAALDAYYHRGPAVGPAGELMDIDYYLRIPVTPYTPADECIPKNLDKIRGDDIGPTYTLVIPSDGKVAFLPTLQWLSQYPSAAYRDFQDWLSHHRP
jgi:RHS repeat-associated protein